MSHLIEDFYVGIARFRGNRVAVVRHKPCGKYIIKGRPLVTLKDACKAALTHECEVENAASTPQE